MRLKRLTSFAIFVWLLTPHQTFAQTETLDLKRLAKKATPAVMLLVVYDAGGKEIATGTGFLVSADGKLVSNLHVAEGAARVVAKADNGGVFSATVSRRDSVNDIALLKVTGKDLPFLNLGDTTQLQVGERVAVIGSPLGLEGTLSEGIVSAIREVETGRKWLQITAAISPGSSGSPVLNSKGEVIGIATALIQAGQSLNFAVPVEVAKNLLSRNVTLDELIAEEFGKGTVPPQSTDRGQVEAAIEVDPDYKECVAAWEKEDYAEALKRARVLVGKYPKNSRAYLELGRVYSAMNFSKDGIAACRQAVAINPENANAWFVMGGAYGFFSAEAVDAYQHAIKAQPDYAAAWRNLGMSYDMQGLVLEAYGAYKQALNLDPSDKFLITSLTGHSGTGSEHEMIRSILPNFIEEQKKAIKQNPQDKVAWIKLFSVHEAQKDLASFVAFAKIVLAEGGDRNRSTWHLFKHACEQGGQLNELITLAKDKLRRQPEDLMLWLDLRTACRLADKNGDLAEFARESIKSNSTNHCAWDALSSAYENQANKAGLVDFCRAEIQTNAANSGPWSALANAYEHETNNATVVEVVGRYPDNMNALLVLGGIQYKWGNYSDATAPLEKYLRLKPDNLNIWLLLVDSYDKQGKEKEAKDAFGEILKLSPSVVADKRKEYEDAKKAHKRWVEQMSGLEAQPSRDEKKDELYEWEPRLKQQLELVEKYAKKTYSK